MCMKKIVLFFIAFFPLLFFSNDLKPSYPFIENKGQFYDQNNTSRNDILFGATDGKLTFHFRKQGVSYQQYRVDHTKEENDFITGKKHSVVDKQTIYRIDIN